MTEERRKTIREQADDCADRIDELQGKKEEAPTRADRRVLNQRIHMLQNLEKWLRTRNGYE